MIILLCVVQEGGNEFVTALTYLAAGLFKADVVTELYHRFVPGKRMKVHGIQKSAVQVKMAAFGIEASRYAPPINIRSRLEFRAARDRSRILEQKRRRPRGCSMETLRACTS